MREFLSPHRQNTPQYLNRSPQLPAQKDDDLTAIMARRRQMADSGRDVFNSSGTDPFVNKNRPKTASAFNSSMNEQTDSEHMRSDLYQAMQKRRHASENGSIHQSPRQRLNKEKFKHVNVDTSLRDKLHKRRLFEDAASVESGTVADDEGGDDMNKSVGSAGTFVREYAPADASVQHSELSNRGHSEEDNEAESSVSEHDLGGGHDTGSEAYTSDDNDPFKTEVRATDKEYVIEDEQAFVTDDDQAYITDDDQAYVTEEESYVKEAIVESRRRPTRGQKHDDSFFAQPSLATLGSFNSVGGANEDDPFVASVRRDDSFFTAGTLAATSEAGTVVEMDYTDDEEELEFVEEGEEGDEMQEQKDEQTVYEEQTVVDDDDEEVNAGLGASDEEGGHLNDIAEEDEEEYEDDDEEYDEEECGEDIEHDGEDDPVYEVDTLGSSAKSGNASEDAWSVDPEERRDVLGGLDDHFDDMTNSMHYGDFDGERSILGELSVLDVVHEEDDQASNHDQASNNDNENVYGGKIVDGRVDRDVPVGSDDDQHSDIVGASGEIGEQAPLTSNKKKRAASRYRLPWIIGAVLLCSVALGVGIGIFFQGGLKDKKPVEANQQGAVNATIPEKQGPAATSSPSIDPGKAKLSPEVLATYDLICAHLLNCDGLLDMFTPQGQAFDWLVNNKTANPSAEQNLSLEAKIRRYSLATVYYSTQGATWANKTNWLSEKDECDWFSTAATATACGVNNKEFTALELDNNNVQGELPYEVALLSSLTSISLRNPVGTMPYIRGGISPHLSALTSLTSLVISGNQFSGGIPAELGKLTSIATLDLSDNGLNGEIPAAFASLSKLTSLSLKGNFLMGDIDPSFFEGAKGLIEVNLERNRLNSVPASIIGLEQLRTLNIGANQLSTIPLVVTQLVNLVDLDLRENGFAGQIPVQLGRMSSLRKLDLSGNNFSGNIPVELGNLVQLVELLDLSENELTGLIPSRLGQLILLKRLRLEGNKLTGAVPVELAALSYIEEIRVDDNDLTGAVPEKLCALYDVVQPASYADCGELNATICFTNCCTDGVGCVCRFEMTDPLRCIKGLQ